METRLKNLTKWCESSSESCLHKVHENSVIPINFDLAALKLFLVLNPVLDWGFDEYLWL